MSSPVSAIVTATMVIYPPQQQFEDSEKAAWDHLSKAPYCQFKIDEVAKKVEEKYVPKDLCLAAPYITIVSRPVVEGRIYFYDTF